MSAFGDVVHDDWDSPELTAGDLVRYEQLLQIDSMCDAELADGTGDVWLCTRLHRGEPGQHVATGLPDGDGVAAVGAVWIASA